MIMVLGVLLISSLLLTAVFYALQGEIGAGNTDLAAKRAYAAATAGVNAYLYQLNQNPNYWETCGNDTQTAMTVPGSSDGASYSYAPIYANGNTACTSNMINALVDTTTGTIRMVFTGTAGNPVVTRSVVVSFRMNSPLDFLWYTHYESFDSSIPGHSDCAVFYRVSGGRDPNCNISWFTGDTMNGPMYTDDQYLVASGATPTFGRNKNDLIESSEPLASSTQDICSGNNCGSANIQGTPVPNATPVPTPSDNSELLTDAEDYGQVFTGTTTIAVNGTIAAVTNCPSTSSACTTSNVDITQYPIIYVTNSSGCTPATYNPTSVTYPTNSSGNYAGCAGDVYISGNYSSPLTIGAADDIIVDSNRLTGAPYGITTSTSDASGNPTGPATLGLVANEYVRVEHGCSGTNVGSQTLSNPVIDAAILALDHSFMADNYNCGTSPGTLNVHGAIAQYFRGAVGTGSGVTVSTGYVKNYNYDDRLANILPPYLFDISNAGWHISRETLCATAVGGACAG